MPQNYGYGQGYGKLGDPSQMIHYSQQPFRNGVRIVSPQRGQQVGGYQLRPQPYHQGVIPILQSDAYPPLTNMQHSMNNQSMNNMHAINNHQVGGYY
jgi:hypothetical protein